MTKECPTDEFRDKWQKHINQLYRLKLAMPANDDYLQVKRDVDESVETLTEVVETVADAQAEQEQEQERES